jgi:Family of unknown function (DUF6502)
MPQAHNHQPSASLGRALRKVLRPLVHLMMVRGIHYSYLSDLIKSLMVEIADRDFQIDGKPSTDSRVSLISGVHRKDVKRLRQGGSVRDDDLPSVVSLGAQLVGQWLGKPEYLDEAGNPKPLPRYASEGGAQSFEGLVVGINSDIRSRVVLDEWIRLGVVHLDDMRRVCLNTQAFVPAKGFDEKLHYFGHNLHDHAAAAAHNLLGVGPPFLERSVHYTGLRQEDVNLLAEQSMELGMRALRSVNKTAMLAEALTPNQAASGRRMTFGIYFYSEADPASIMNPPSATGDQDDIPT